MGSQEQKSQADKILAFLEQHANSWVSVWDVIRAGRTLSHTRRISDIKSKGFVVLQRFDENHHSEYKLVKSGEQLRLIA